MEEGFVKLYRSLTKKGYYRNSKYVHLWVYLLMKASYQEKEYLFNNKIEHLQPGQFIVGRKAIRKETGISETTIERILTCFESEQQIGQQKNNKFRIISILNWDKYQGSGQQNGHQMDNKRTSSGHLADTIKKEKKEKKEKNIYAESVTLTEEEFLKLKTENGEYVTNKAIQLLSNYKLSSGKRYKSDYHTILGWPLERAKGAGNGTGQPTGRYGVRPTPQEDPSVIADVEAINAKVRLKQLAREIAQRQAADSPEEDAS